MNSKEYINDVKDDASIITKEKDGETWCVKVEDALKAIDMAKEETAQEITDTTLYSIKKGDFVTIYNPAKDDYVDGKIERITKSAFYFTAATTEEKVYSRNDWSLKIVI